MTGGGREASTVYVVVENIELRDRPGLPPVERLIGTYPTAAEALDVGRKLWGDYTESGRLDYAWWVVRREGSTLAEWIADSRSSKEFVVDLRSGQLVELP